jgi:hypothetical protein
MSGGGGSSSDSGSTDMQVSGAEAVYSNEPGISTYGGTQASAANTGYTDDGSGDYYSDVNYSKQQQQELQNIQQSMGDNYDPQTADTSGTATDPGLAGKDAVTWTVDKDGKLTAESTPDSITNFGQNLQAELKSRPLGYLTPVGTLTKVGAQTLAANYLLGNIKNPFATWNSPSQDYFNKINPPVSTGDSGGDSTTQQVSTPTQTISGVAMESPAQKFYNQQQQTGQLSFQSDYDAAKQKVNGLLGSPSAVGLLAVNESPFYDFLKSINLNRRII